MSLPTIYFFWTSRWGSLLQRAQRSVPFLLLLFILLSSLYLALPLFSGPSDLAEIDALAPVEVIVEGLREPTGVAVDRNGVIFVSDRKAGEIFKIDGGEAEPVVSDLKRPVGLGFDPEGRLLIVEEGKGRLLRLEENGGLTPLAQGMKRPRWVTVAENETIYVSAKGLRSDKDRRDDDDEEKDEESEQVILRLVSGELSTFAGGFKALRGLVIHGNTVFAAAKGLRRGRDHEQEREAGGSLSNSRSIRWLRRADQAAY